ncbi:hypothetical protein Bequi_01895 [Brachybacterium sp. JHP9]|uniref:Uncharacterized protein n=1 Tax=Brachybacterium equifaecis TaxID=2910770 RepID=A0ABT0QXC4_9MICO|nr:hypothetical protein [Brachybacterium equifaecis]MCL6422154.1 hypothetical protein [Brachybacterium equifaecis]
MTTAPRTVLSSVDLSRADLSTPGRPRAHSARSRLAPPLLVLALLALLAALIGGPSLGLGAGTLLCAASLALLGLSVLAARSVGSADG